MVHAFISPYFLKFFLFLYFKEACWSCMWKAGQWVVKPPLYGKKSDILKWPWLLLFWAPDSGSLFSTAFGFY